MIGRYPVSEIAEKMNTSVSNIKRAFRGKSIWFKNGKWKQRPELTRKVIEYYFMYGMPATVKKFPEVNVRVIVDRPEYYGIKRNPRQIRWTDKQLIELAKMAGIISMKAQAKYFNRPNANEGSIKSALIKRFGVAAGTIHGLSNYRAKELIEGKCLSIKTRYWDPRDRKRPNAGRTLYLWVDLENAIDPNLPQFIQEAIKTMADFQRWLFGKNPRARILRMISEREIND